MRVQSVATVLVAISLAAFCGTDRTPWIQNNTQDRHHEPVFRVDHVDPSEGGGIERRPLGSGGVTRVEGRFSSPRLALVAHQQMLESEPPTHFDVQNPQAFMPVDPRDLAPVPQPVLPAFDVGNDGFGQCCPPSMEPDKVNAELRIHHGDCAAGPTAQSPADITLREAFERHWLPTRIYTVGKSKPTEYRRTITLWEAFVDERASSTTTGAQDSLCLVQPIDLVSQISAAMLNEFGLWLMVENSAIEKPAMKQSTVTQHANRVHAILRSVGPPSDKYPEAADLIKRIPKMHSPAKLSGKKEKPTKGRNLTTDELGAIYEACEIATWPSDQAVLQWKTAFVLYTCIGTRANDGAGITHDQVWLDITAPMPEVRLTNRYGWIHFDASKTRKEQLVPMPPCLYLHASELLKRRGGRMFQWRSAKNHSFVAQWNAIVDQAGLSGVVRKDFRTTCNNLWNDASPGSTGLGPIVLGHAARNVNEKHYVDNLPALIQATEELAVPSQYNADLREGPTQQFLF